MEYIFYAFVTFLDYYSQEEAKVAKQTQQHKPVISVSAKKKQFFALVVPPIQKVYQQLYTQYHEIQQNLHNPDYQDKILRLKKLYKVESDEALLQALKPHPVSIAIAQAAMESAWGTSRFFREANNLFGMWSTSKKDKRIAAGEQRNGNKTIWLRKFDSIEDSVRAYYLTLSRAKTYQNFRQLNYETNNVFDIIEGLEKYSERGHKYVEELASMIRYNKLTKYDEMETK